MIFPENILDKFSILGYNYYKEKGIMVSRKAVIFLT